MGFRFPSAAIIVLLLLPCPASMAQLSSESIEAAQRYSATHDGIAMIVKERGRLRMEKYYNGYDGSPLHIYSGTKSFFGLLAVMAEEDLLLKLDEKVAETLPEWRDDARKNEITVRDLLNFTSGLEAGTKRIYRRSSHDKISLAVSLDMTRDRGQSFVYGPSHLNVFCEVLRRKLKRLEMSYEEYLEEKLIGPLGIRIARWRKDAHGNPFPSAGMHMSGRDWIRFGELINSGGIWNEHRLVKKENLMQCFSGTRINPSFGLCFWLNSYAIQPDAREVHIEKDLELDPTPEDWSNACLCKDAPPDLVVSLGSNSQRLYLVPSMDLIVVHLGKSGHDFRDFEFLRILFADTTIRESREPI